MWNCTLRARTDVSVLVVNRQELGSLVGPGADGAADAQLHGQRSEVLASLRQLGLLEQRSWLVHDRLRSLDLDSKGLGDDLADLLL